MRISDWSSDVCSSDLIYLRRSDASDGAQTGARVDFVLRHDESLRAETLDDRTYIGANAGARHQHGHFASAARILEGIAHRGDEFLQLRWLHGDLVFFALADDRLRSEGHTSELQSPMRHS